MFPLSFIHSLCQGELLPTLVFSPFWVKPLNKHNKSKICYIIWTQRPWFTLRIGYLHYLEVIYMDLGVFANVLHDNKFIYDM
jgi:hypothetical protein